MYKRIHTYDLDGTLIDSSHRYRELPNGSIDLQFWVDNATPENIARDRLLPLAENYKADLINPEIYVIIATARRMKGADFQYVRENLGEPNHWIFRGLKDERSDAELKKSALRGLINLKQFKNCVKMFWDDNLNNLRAVNSLGFTCINCR